MEIPTLLTNLHISNNPHPSDSPDLALTQDDEPLPDSHIRYWAACLHCHRTSHNKLHCHRYTLMQLAIDEDRRVQKPSEGLEMKAEAGCA